MIDMHGGLAWSIVRRGWLLHMPVVCRVHFRVVPGLGLRFLNRVAWLKKIVQRLIGGRVELVEELIGGDVIHAVHNFHELTGIKAIEVIDIEAWGHRHGE